MTTGEMIEMALLKVEGIMMPQKSENAPMLRPLRPSLDLQLMAPWTPASDLEPRCCSVVA